MDGHAPFFFDIDDGQIDGFLCCLVIGELDLGFGILAYAAVEVFNGVVSSPKNSTF